MTLMPDAPVAEAITSEDTRVKAAAQAAGFDAAEFRSEIRAFCSRSLQGELAEKARKHQYFSRDDRIRWQRALQQWGWLVPHWPSAVGGQDWGPLRRFILIEELEAAGTPWLTHFGVSFLGPVLCEFGNKEQCDRFLEPIRLSKTWWCQGFSEPGAGSDLASLTTRAERRGDHYLVNGQKTWTTMAHWADMIFCLVRTHTADRPQQGISFLLIDLKSPGVSVRPIETIDGLHHVNEVFFEDVKVPVENLVANEGDGWAIAKFIVNRERLLVAEIGKARRALGTLAALASSVTEGGKLLGSHSPALRRRCAELKVQYATLRAMAYSLVLDAEAGRAAGHADASMLKIRGSELQQALSEALLGVVSREGLAFQREGLFRAPYGERHGVDLLPGLIHEQLHSRSISIYGGSNEIQKEIIARSVLGA